MYKIKDTTKKNAVYSAFEKRAREFKNRVTFGYYRMSGNSRSFIPEKTVESLTALNVKQEANGGSESISVGNACVSSFSASFFNTDKSYIYSNKIAFVECGIKLSDNSFHYIPLGYFNCDKSKTDDDGQTVSIEGYDEIANMKEKWSYSKVIDDTTTLYDMVENIAQSFGLQTEYEYSIVQTRLKNIKLNNAGILQGYTFREVLGFCAGCVGRNARINTEGKLRIGWYNGDSYYKIGTDVQYQNGFVREDDKQIKIESVTSGIDERIFTKGSGKGITFLNPIITQDQVDQTYYDIVEYLKASFIPGECTWRGNPCIEAGDIVKVVSKSGTTSPFYIASQDLDLAGGLISTIVCLNIDEEESLETIDTSTKHFVERVRSDLQKALLEAAGAINGANGGYFRVLENSMQPYGWECFDTRGLEGIRCTYGGIGCTADGGRTYKSAMTGRGFVGDAITVGRINGANERFFLDLETGETSFSDIKITGGSIDMYGGSSQKLRIRTEDGFGIDLSNANISMYAGIGQSWGEPSKIYDVLPTAMIYPLENKMDWYATHCVRNKCLGFRFGKNCSNEQVVGLTVSDKKYWQTDYAQITENAGYFKRQIITNDYRLNQYAALTHGRGAIINNQLTQWAIKVGAGVNSNCPTISFEVRDDKLADGYNFDARMDMYNRHSAVILDFSSWKGGQGALKFENNILYVWNGSAWRQVVIK